MPDLEVVETYRKEEIGQEQLVNMYECFMGITGSHDIEVSAIVSAEDKLKELKETLQCSDVEHRDTEIRLIKGGYVIASIFLNEKDKNRVQAVFYFSFAKLICSEIYLGDLTYTEYFKTAKSENGGLYAKLTRRTFFNRDNSVAFDQIFEEGKEWYLFPDGKRYTNLQLMVEFVRSLKLSKEDVVFLDDSVSEELVEAVFTFGKVARIVVLAHAGHYFEIEKSKNKDVGISERSILKEYPYKWFRYAEAIDTMVVSTNEQKEFLKAELERYYCMVPNIRVVSIEGEFTYAVLHESYGGNMALSWTFHGKPDGFLIYDESGNLLYETRNEHQHYQLVKGHERGGSFVVKAFVDTACGRTVIAELELVYLSTRNYEKPLVSLIIPIYNAEDYIARTLDNALAQSLTDLEIIAVDDGCTDSSPEILEWYAKRYPNVVVIHKENGGVTEARNTGIEAAQGEYIGFMDNDDMIRPEMMEKMYKSVKKNDCDVVISSVLQILNHSYETWIQYHMEQDKGMPIEKFLHDHYLPSCAWGLVLWNKLYRASIVKMRPLPHLKSDEDVAWTPYILSYADKVCYLDGWFYEWDRSLRKTTFGIEVRKKTVEERVESYKNAIVFYLENGNGKRVDLLKEVAMLHLHMLGIWYAWPELEMLRQQIDENF